MPDSEDLLEQCNKLIPTTVVDDLVAGKIGGSIELGSPLDAAIEVAMGVIHDKFGDNDEAIFSFMEAEYPLRLGQLGPRGSLCIVLVGQIVENRRKSITN